VDGIATARRAQAHFDAMARSPSDKSLTYGEISFSSFPQILDFVMRLRPTAERVFVDLGCGTGKAVFAAALSEARFSLCWGIEIVPELLDHALSVKTMFDELPRGGPSALRQPTLTNKSSNGNAGNGALAQKSAKVLKEPSDSDVIDKIFQLLESSKSAVDAGDGARSLAADFVASKVCEAVGHKAFKLFVKKHKSFTLFVKESCEGIFEIDNKDIRSLPPSAGGAAAVSGSVSDSDGDVQVDEGEEGKEEGEGARSESGDHQAEVAVIRPVDRIEMAGDRALFEYVPEIRLDVGDIFVVPWWESASVVYVASLLFTDSMMERLVDLVLKMSAGSVVISLKPFPRLGPAPSSPCSSSMSSSHSYSYDSYSPLTHAAIAGNEVEGRARAQPSLRLVSDSFYRMSWQMAQVLIYVVNIMQDQK
jgi:hypothetical protein